MRASAESPGFAKESRNGGNETVSTILAPIDILDTKDEVQIFVELPGVEPSRVQLEVQQGELLIEATRTIPIHEKSKSLMREFNAVQFKRNLKLADTLDQEKIWAEQSLGVLKIHLPKKAETQKRKIEVRPT